MSNPFAGLRGRVTFTVLVVTAALYSLLGTVGFVAIANGGRDAIEERITEVLDDFEASVRTGTGASDLSTADGVDVHAELGWGTPPPAPEGTLQVTRRIDAGGTKVTLVGVSSQARLTDSLRSLYRGLWIAIPLAAIVSALMAGLATRRALRPVGNITELAATIGGSQSGTRVPVPDTGDEIERLAVTVNEMLDRIDEGRAAQRRFTSDAAHELRTPLMALQGEVELARHHGAAVDDAMLDRLEVLSHRLGDRIDDLVLLSTLDEARPLVMEPVELTTVVRDEAATLGRIEVEGPPTHVVVDRALMARALRNLLANASRHARERVTATVADDGQRVWVHVDDDGPGIEPAQREAMFRRFTRLDESRSADRGGSGLGLAIVASVAAAHHGGVEATDGPLGGARLSLWLPTAADPTATTPSTPATASDDQSVA